MTDAEKNTTDTVVFTAPESGLYQFSDGKITLTKRIGENCIYCSELCSDLMRNEHRIKHLEARVEKLRSALEKLTKVDTWFYYYDKESMDNLPPMLVSTVARAALKEDEEMR